MEVGMREHLFLFTLHKSEEDFRIVGSAVARSAQEAVSILGGEYIAVENQPPGSSKNRDELGLHGRIKFAPELFRYISHDYGSGHYYSVPGIHIWADKHGCGREIVLRRNNYVALPAYISVP
jgi:hypothetical protein